MLFQVCVVGAVMLAAHLYFGPHVPAFFIFLIVAFGIACAMLATKLLSRIIPR